MKAAIELLTQELKSQEKKLETARTKCSHHSLELEFWQHEFERGTKKIYEIRAALDTLTVPF